MAKTSAVLQEEINVKKETGMSEHFLRLTTLLRELFQLDQPDLDFGFYRIMHSKADEVTQFLDSDLLPQVKEAFKNYQNADEIVLKEELKKASEAAKAAGFSPEEAPKVKEIKEKLAATGKLTNADQLEREVYDYLYSFFRRYYSEGDFLSKRVYKQGVYAIPYEGEEVKLHWANKDQYYIKTSEYLRDYTFKLRPEDDKNPMRVHFKLVDAEEGEHNNVKTAKEKERRFILAKDNPVEKIGEELVIRFEYRAPTGEDFEGAVPKQGDKIRTTLNAQSERALLSLTDAKLADWVKELQKKHINASGEATERTKLAVHLDRYTARNTFDYFIHKDLGGFLRRELDFFIKNEILHLDDIESDTAPRVEQYLSKIKVIRKIAGKLIDFLAQLEDFQKKLWLKKKFVVETNYCITLDRIDEKFYPEIAKNEAQRKEWVELFAVEDKPLSVEVLKSQRYLVLDTRHFEASFKERLLDTLDKIEDSSNGLLIRSENFQAIKLLGNKYEKKIDYIYIDPPYNTDSAPILYKNDYRDSSWMSLLQDRVIAAKNLLSESGIKTVAIDDTELVNLSKVLEENFPQSRVTKVTVIHNPKGSITKDFNRVHEYAVFLTPNDKSECIARTMEENDTPRKMRRWGENSLRTDRRPSFYPIYVKKGKVVRVGVMPDDDFHPKGKNVLLETGEVEIWPIDQDGVERRWNFGLDSIHQNLERVTVQEVDGNLDLFLTHELTVPKTVWYGGEYDAGKYGNSLLIDMLGEKKFDFPKSINLVKKCVYLATDKNKNAIILDYFGGSGTTGHAVVQLNLEDKGARKYILVEFGDHFETVVLPRMKKAVYSKEWKEGKPLGREGVSHLLKYIRLESYEDTLNNLQLKRSKAQKALFDLPEAKGADKLKEQYVLRYMMEKEAAGSASLLNVETFSDPMAYKLNVKISGSDESREVNVDLLETFNYLIGLWVDHIAAPLTFSAKFKQDKEGRWSLDGKLTPDDKGAFWFRRVEGVTRDGRKTLVIWRKLTGNPQQDNLALDHFMKDRLKINTRDFEFDMIYVNGDNNLENLRQADEKWKVRLIEEDFRNLMFDMGGI